MSESLPPTKKSSAGLIALGVLLLLGAAGGVFWKISRSNNGEVVEETVKVSAPVATPAPLGDAPPPPPSEEELADLDKKDEPATAASGTKSSGPAGCSSKCAGTAGADLKTALGARGGQARGCYQRALRLNSTLEGKMSVALKLSPTGGVCSASIGSDTMNDPAVTTCVLQNFRSGKYPAPQGGCVDVNVPLSFVSK